MNKIPSTLTKNQAIAFAVVAFNNFINSGNTSCFDVSTIETFYTGAMEGIVRPTVKGAVVLNELKK